MRTLQPDVLMREKTAYDVLGVSPGADAKAVMAAFAAGLGAAEDRDEFLAAKNELLNQTDSGLIDVMFYGFYGADGARLDPDPVSDPMALSEALRRSASDAWSEALKDAESGSGASPAIVHSLALLWFWWAIRAEESGLEGKSEGAWSKSGFDAKALWLRTIAYFGAMVVNMQSNHRFQEPIQDWRALGQGLENKLTSTLTHYQGRWRGLDDKQAERFHGLQITWTEERRLAEGLRDVQIPVRENFYCGRQLLKELGLLDEVRGKVRNALSRTKDPNLKERLELLLKQLDIFGTVLPMSPCKAKEDWDQQPEWKKQNSEVREEGVKLCHQCALEKAGRGDMSEAVTLWWEALEYAENEGQRKEIKKAVSANCLKWARPVYRNFKPDGPEIQILQDAYDLTQDEEIQTIIAEIKNPPLQRPISRPPRTSSSTSSTSHSETRLPNLGAVERYMKKIMDARKKDAWDKAIALARWAQAKVGSELRGAFNPVLANLLANRCVIKVNRALAMMGESTKLITAIQGMVHIDPEPCNLCHNRVLYGRYATVSRQDGAQIPICIGCSKAMDRERQKMKNVMPRIRMTLNSGFADIEEAARLDPGDGYVENQRGQLHELAGNLGVTLQKAPRLISRPELWVNVIEVLRSPMGLALAALIAWHAVFVFHGLTNTPETTANPLLGGVMSAFAAASKSIGGFLDNNTRVLLSLLAGFVFAPGILSWWRKRH